MTMDYDAFNPTAIRLSNTRTLKIWKDNQTGPHLPGIRVSVETFLASEGHTKAFVFSIPFIRLGEVIAALAAVEQIAIDRRIIKAPFGHEQGDVQ
jgi:hypothetical protein